MKITIIYDNTVFQQGLKSDWGFSCFVEVYGKKILFDTGADGAILLGNMKRLNIKPTEVEEVFISHYHWDHTGGLSDFLKVNPVKVYIPSSFEKPCIARDVVVVKKSITIGENIFSTGELNGVEQSLIVKTEKGVVIIVGCSHSGVGNILETASQLGKPYALIGGLHGFSDFDLVKDLTLICPTHCTQHISEIKSLYPDKYINGGAGKVIEI